MATIDVRTRTAATPAPSSSTTPSSASSPTCPVMHQVVTAQLAGARAGTQRPRPAPRSAAAAPSRGARRAPAAPARARPARRTGPAVAWPSARSPAATSRRPPRRWCSSRCARRCRDRASRGQASSSSTAWDFDDAQDQGRRRRARARSASTARCSSSSAREDDAALQVVPQPARRAHPMLAGELNAYDVLVQRLGRVHQGKPCPAARHRRPGRTSPSTTPAGRAAGAEDGRRR